MIGEVNLYGVLLPPLLVWVALAVGASALVRLGLERMGVYRFVWHRPLFDLALLVILTGVISAVAGTVF